jgi:site-specific recombinase XerD
MSQLRKRFIRDLNIRNYSQNTIKNYVTALSQLASHFGKCPSEISSEELKEYLNLLTLDNKSWSTVNMVISSVSLLYSVTLEKPSVMKRIARPKNVSKIPTVLSVEEVERFFATIRNLKHRALFMTIYSAGLRVGEARNLKSTDIDSSRMRIILRDAKGHKDREVILSDKLLGTLREYYSRYRPRVFLFFGFSRNVPISASTIQKICKNTLNKAKIDKKASTHTLRHSYATHLMDKGIDMRIIQALLGHKSIKTTMKYCHLTKSRFADVKSPLDDLSI